MCREYSTVMMVIDCVVAKIGERRVWEMMYPRVMTSERINTRANMAGVLVAFDGFVADIALHLREKM